jgi:hypothetical protein
MLIFSRINVLAKLIGSLPELFFNGSSLTSLAFVALAILIP